MPGNDAKTQESVDPPSSPEARSAFARDAVRLPDTLNTAESSSSPSIPAAQPVVREKPATGNKPGRYKPWTKKTEEEKQAARKQMYGTTESPFKLKALYDGQEDYAYEQSAVVRQ